MKEIYDAIVIGDGPVGLHAAASCAHFNLSVLVIGRERCIDRGKERKGRCHYAREIFNHPAFEKISGEELIEMHRKKLQNEMYRDLVDIVDTKAVDIQKKKGIFELMTKDDRKNGMYKGKNVILCAGAMDEHPASLSDRMIKGISDPMKNVYPFAGVTMHYCIFCDGYTMRDKICVVIGKNLEAVEDSLILTHFRPKKITILTNGINKIKGLNKPLENELKKHGIEIITKKIKKFAGRMGALEGIQFEDDSKIECKAGLVAMDLKPYNEIAKQIGAKLNNEGFVITDGYTARTNVEGFYAAGDVTDKRKQIEIGYGDAKKAAIDIFRRMRHYTDERLGELEGCEAKPGF